MKAFWCCVTAAAALLSVTNAVIDVEKTVKQVQSILQANDLLPRLTREEILQLLNDIREEDARSSLEFKDKSKIVKTKQKPSTIPENILHDKVQVNEFNSQIQSGNDDTIDIKQNEIKTATISTRTVESTTKANTPTLTVVLPYTPRDGSSLQELYTRPPRLQVVTEKVTPKPSKTTKSTYNKVKIANKPKIDFPEELQAFLDAHGLKSNTGQDNFLLPLDGFKPLPPAKIVDGTVQLPENLLLTYDLISPSDSTLSTTTHKNQAFSQTNFLYEPLRPEIPFELDTSSSETKHIVLPLDLPKPRKTKAIPDMPKHNYEPVDYDSVRVIPLNKGPNPVEDEAILNTAQNKRQTNNTDSKENTTNIETAIVETEVKDTSPTASDIVASDPDTGASIADLEDSFGGAAPSVPGDSDLPPPKKNGFYWMVDWNSFLEVGDGDTKVNIRFEPKLGDPQMFLPVNVP